MPVVDETNILALIPGDRIGNAARTLLDAVTSTSDTQEVTIDVPGRFVARVTFPGSRGRPGVDLKSFGPEVRTCLIDPQVQ